MRNLREYFGRVSRQFENWRWKNAVKLAAEVAPTVDKLSLHTEQALEIFREGNHIKVSLGLGHFVYIRHSVTGEGYDLAASNDSERKYSVVPMPVFEPWKDEHGRTTNLGYVKQPSQLFTWLLQAWKAARPGVELASEQRLDWQRGSAGA